MKSRLLAPLAILAVAVAPGSAGASHQAPGCQSTAVKTGTLTSPPLDLSTFGTPELRFSTWWEIESVGAHNRDTMYIEYSVNGLSGPWLAAAPAVLNPVNPVGGAAPSTPLSDDGLGARPSFPTPPTRSVHSIPQAALERNVRVRFRFDSFDTARNGFRGWAVDDVNVTDFEGPPTAQTTFEGTNPAPGWTFTGFWHVVSESDGVAMSPQIVPALVTLGANDNGTLPDDPANPQGVPQSRYAWFGENATGTYCGADALVEPGTPTLALTPESAGRQVGETHVIAAATTNAPAGSSVRFDVSGANPGAGAAPVDPGSGTAAISVLGANAGQDSVSAYLDLDGSATPGPSEPVAAATVSWAPRQVVMEDLDAPEPFREVNVEPVSGDVFVRLPGGAPLPSRSGARSSQSGAPPGFIPLRAAAQIPMGSQLETTRGRVLVESAASRTRGRTQRAQFYSGRFQLLQRRAARPITDIVLKGGSFRGCARSGKSSAGDRPTADASQRRRRGARVRRVWGDGRGRFRTRGRYSSATVRGTKWVTEDRCNGTLTRVARRPRSNRVAVRDFVRRRSVTLRAGQSYFAFKRSRAETARLRIPSA